MSWRSVFVACLMLLCAAPAYAQFDSANISGVVQDTTGAILPGVDVTLTNVGTKIARQAVTNEAGLYTFPNVPVGEYQVTAMLSGFKPITKAGVQVNAGLNIRVDVALEVGVAQRDDSSRGGDDAGGHVGASDARCAPSRSPKRRSAAGGRRRSRSSRLAWLAATWAARCRPASARSPLV